MASKKKGLSADEKRKRLLELFYESNEFFQMKELEKLAPKTKGIVSQSVKEITQMLVDDGLVECEKIGTFVCYWAFPSKAAAVRKRRLDELNAKITRLNEQIQSTETEIKEAKAGKEDSEQRQTLLADIAKLDEKKKMLEEKLQKFADNDPAIIEKIANDIEQAKSEANRWTDNIFAMKKWCKRKFGIEEKAFNQQFEVPAELDYLE